MLFTAPVLCRPVANKQEFRQWVLRRYNAFMSSIQQATEASIHLDLQSGGTRVNNLAVSRPTLRKVVFKIIKDNYTDIRTAAVMTHIKMLTALSEMTTYSLVQRVIATGGSVIFMSPLPQQILQFMREKQEVEETIIKGGYQRDDLIYVHLFMPHYQCFKSAQYPDLIVTANALEEFVDPRNRTLDKFKAKIENATINVKQLKAFLAAQSSNITCSIDDTLKEDMRKHFGDAIDTLLADADRVVKLLARQARPD